MTAAGDARGIPELTPRDIIVMVADIDSLSPYIQAVSAAPAMTLAAVGDFRSYAHQIASGAAGVVRCFSAR